MDTLGAVLIALLSGFAFGVFVGMFVRMMGKNHEDVLEPKSSDTQVKRIGVNEFINNHATNTVKPGEFINSIDFDRLK